MKLSRECDNSLLHLCYFFLWPCFSYIPVRPSDWREKHWWSLKSSKCHIQISPPALQKMGFTQWLLTTTSSSYLHPDLESISQSELFLNWKSQSDLCQGNVSSSTFCGRHPQEENRGRLSLHRSPDSCWVARNCAKSLCNLLPTWLLGCDTLGVKPQSNHFTFLYFSFSFY